MEIITIFNDVEKNRLKLRKFFFKKNLFDFEFLYQLGFVLLLEMSLQRFKIFYLCFE
jgi:hypothetical protein